MPQDRDEGGAPRHAVAALSRSKWELGDLALEIVPGRGRGEAFTDEEKGRLTRFAEEIDLRRDQLERYRIVARAWPETTRAGDFSWSVYRELMYEEDRAELIASRDRWTFAEAQAVTRERRDARWAATCAEWQHEATAAPRHVSTPFSALAGEPDVDKSSFASPLTDADFSELHAEIDALAMRLAERRLPDWGADGLRLAAKQIGAAATALAGVEIDVEQALADLEAGT